MRLSYSRSAFIRACFIPFGDGRALVVGLFALRQRDLDLGASLLEINARWHDRHPLDAHVVPQFEDLFFVKQQLSPAFGLVIEMGAGLFIGRDMRLDKPGLRTVADV